MFERLMANPFFVALVSAQFLPYALVAFGVIGVRVLGGKMRGREILFALLVALMFAVEGEQMWMSGHQAREDILRGINRYFGVLAPFLWIFAARGMSYVWSHSKAFVRWTGRVVIVPCLAWVFLMMNVVALLGYQAAGTAFDTVVAVGQIVPVIKADYAGPAKQPVVKRSLHEYYTGKRPLVICPFAAAGWAIRGDSCGVTGAQCPYPDDYLFFPLNSGFNGITEVDERVYQPITRVRGGLGTTWALYRRRTTPGRYGE